MSMEKEVAYDSRRLKYSYDVLYNFMCKFVFFPLMKLMCPLERVDEAGKPYQSVISACSLPRSEVRTLEGKRGR